MLNPIKLAWHVECFSGVETLDFWIDFDFIKNFKLAATLLADEKDIEKAVLKGKISDPTQLQSRKFLEFHKRTLESIQPDEKRQQTYSIQKKNIHDVGHTYGILAVITLKLFKYFHFHQLKCVVS